jgi:hypothetical protein
MLANSCVAERLLASHERLSSMEYHHIYRSKVPAFGLHLTLFGWRNEEGEVAGICRMYTGLQNKDSYLFSMRSLKGTEHLPNLGADGRIILKWNGPAERYSIKMYPEVNWNFSEYGDNPPSYTENKGFLDHQNNFQYFKENYHRLL